jgi:hypothetical protein
MEADVRTSVVRLGGELPTEPIAPATLIDPATKRPVIALHRLVRADGPDVAFETYGITVSPPVGKYLLQSWWVPDALALVADVLREWVRARYPGDATGPFPDHGPDFCVLTYETFEPGDDAYTDGRGAWVSVAGYQKYIEDDLLRLRR